ncbi:hypothetical protein ACFSBX_18945 [Halobellus rarus]|uniref:Uncharacterized protein n=1 Tax=Halobellus rarus TaxID=1126237 RepID=A0ABD6CT89_9EURY
MSGQDVPLTTVITLLFGVVVVNLYIISLSFGLAAGIAFLTTDSVLPNIFTPIAGVLATFATVLIFVRTTIIRMIDDLTD